MSEANSDAGQKSSVSAPDYSNSGAIGIISPDFDPTALLRGLWRRKWIVIVLGLLGGALGFAYAGTLPATYRANVQILLSEKRDLIQQSGVFFDSRRIGRQAVAQESVIIRSPKVLGRVVDDLDLDTYPEFNPALRQPGLMDYVSNFGHEILVLVGARAPRDNDGALVSGDRLKRLQMNTIASRMSVGTSETAWTLMNLSYLSSESNLAALVVNKVADEYLNEQLEAKFEATERSTSWVSERLEELKKQVEIAEAAVLEFRSQQTQAIGQSTELLDQQVATMSGQLIAAESEMTGVELKKRRLDAIVATSDDDAVADFLSATEAGEARELVNSLRREQSELSLKYGDRHPKMIAIRAEVAAAERAFEHQVRKEVQAVKDELSVARSKVAAIKSALRRLESTTSNVNRADIQLRQLEREAEASRMVYSNFLARFKENSNKQGIDQPAARILSYAVRGRQVGPQTDVIVFGAGFGGVAMGLLIALLLTYIESGFRSATQLETTIGLPVLGQIPSVKDLKKGGDRFETVSYMSQNPTSGLAESMRSLRVAITRSNIDNPPQVIMTTSSVPQEAKSVTCALLAQTISQFGKSVIIVDADLRRPTVGDAHSVTSDNTVVEVLAGEASLDEAIVKHAVGTVDLLLGKNIAANANSVVGSVAFGELVNELRQRYDTVIIDVPPVLAVSDALLVGGHVDAILFAVRWGVTPEDAVKNGLKALEDAGLAPSGAVLTRVDLKRQKQYGYSYGDYGYYRGHYGEY